MEYVIPILMLLLPVAVAKSKHIDYKHNAKAKSSMPAIIINIGLNSKPNKPLNIIIKVENGIIISNNPNTNEKYFS